jgi:hypothetical protein
MAVAKSIGAAKLLQAKDSVRVTGKTLGAWLDQAPGHFVVIVGHNQDGYFAFPDGSKRSIEDISEETAKRHKRPIFISCQARKRLAGSKVAYATDRDLSMQEGAEIAAGVLGLLAAKGERPISLEELKAEIEQLDVSTGRRHTVAYVGLLACHALEGAAFAGLVIATVCILLDEDCGSLLPSSKKGGQPAAQPKKDNQFLPNARLLR